MVWGSLYSSSYRENPLKRRENELWEKFSQTGVMPEVPTLGSDVTIQVAHTILGGEYNQLQKVLDGEALARQGMLSEAEEMAQLEAAGWVLKIINSTKRNYAKKDAMAESFLNFKAASKNKRMALACGLDKGSIMLREAAEENKLGLAEKMLSRLEELAAENAINSKLEEFIKLAISVGWIFSKANNRESLKKLITLLPEFGEDEYINKNISSLRDKMQFSEEEPLRKWMKKAKSAVSPNSTTEGVQLLLKELLPLIGIGRWYQGPVEMKDGGLFESRQLALLRVCQLAKKFKNGMSTDCASMILQLFKKDGLEDFSSLFYARRQKVPGAGEQLSPHGKPYWPSLAEDIANQLVKSCKTCYARNYNEAHPDLEWAVTYLESTYSRFTDDEWADFRIGKILIWSGAIARAQERLLPVIRKKQSEYWAWDLLGDLFLKQRKSCVAKALLCDADEKYIRGLKTEATQLGLNLNDNESLVKESESALDLLLSGIPPVDGILLECFKTPEGKKRLVFSDGTGQDAIPLSPKSARLPADIKEGCPVTLYRAPENKKQIVAVKLRPTGSPWDVLTIKKAVYLGTFTDKKGKIISSLVIKENKFLFFHEIKGCVPGTPMKVRFSDHVREGKKPECVWVQKDESPERSLWDALYQAFVLYCGVSKSGNSFTVSSGKFKFNAPKSKFKVLESAALGDAFEIRYEIREKDNEKIRDIVVCNPTDKKPDLTISFSGTIRMASSVGYVDLYDDDDDNYYDDDERYEHKKHPYGSVFVSSDFVQNFKLRGGEHISGTAVCLPSKYHTSRNGRRYENRCYQAISIQLDPVEEKCRGEGLFNHS